MLKIHGEDKSYEPRTITIGEGETLPITIEMDRDGDLIIKQPAVVRQSLQDDDCISLAGPDVYALQQFLNERSQPVALQRDAIRAEAVAEFATKLAAHLKAEDKKLDNELARWDATITVHTNKLESLRRTRGQDYDRQFEVRRLLCKIEDMKESMGDA